LGAIALNANSKANQNFTLPFKRDGAAGAAGASGAVNTAMFDRSRRRTKKKPRGAGLLVERMNAS